MPATPGDDDPDDPDPTGNRKTDDGERFRGYFDTALDQTAGTIIRVHPTKRLRQLKNYPAFSGNDKPTAFIRRPGEAKLFLVLTTTQKRGVPAKDWDWEISVQKPAPSPTFKVKLDPTGAAGMPFATRWSNSVVHTKAFRDGVWMRCASGCCEAQLDVDF
jgi:hypothetical protein